MRSETLKTISRQFCVVVAFGIAFAYIEASVVVYLRAIAHPDGFIFPLTELPLSNQLLLTEIGREAATLVLILTSCWLFGRNNRQRFAYFLTIFAAWDIFYYVWLKILINWPSSIMDWDILFLIPMLWAGPVLAPVVVSLILLVFAVIILYRSWVGKELIVSRIAWFGFIAAAVVVVVSFCIAGLHVAEEEFRSFFYWPLFAAGNISAVVLFLKCLLKSNS